MTSRAWRVSADALRLLTAAAHVQAGESTPEREAEVAATRDRWPELVEAGMARVVGTLDDAWVELVTEAAKGELAWRLVARQGEAGVAVNLAVLPTIGLCLAERRRLRVTESEVEVVAVEDAVTVGIFQPAELWETMRRFVPPHEALRADPGQDDPRDEDLLARVTPDRSVLPDDVLQRLAAADHELSIALHVDRGERPAVVAQRHWAVSGDELLEVRQGAARVDVVRCDPGAVASEVVWMAAGAMDLRAGVMGGAR